MLVEYFEMGGTVMYAVFLCWVLVLSLILDRLLYWMGCGLRRPVASFRQRIPAKDRNPHSMAMRLRYEIGESERGLDRLNSVSQLATSVGLFGTVVGICTAFLSRSAHGPGSISEGLQQGLSTALFTTVFGLSVFLVGQGFLILFQGLSEAMERQSNRLFDGPAPRDQGEE